MSEPWTPSDELQTLAAAAFCGELTEERIGRFEQILREPRACRWYRDLCLLQAELRILATADRADAAAQKCIRREARLLALPVVDISACPQPLPSGHYAAGSMLGNVAQNAAGFFSHGWPLAYLVAVMVLSAGLLVGTFVHVSHPPQVARPSVSLATPHSPLHSFVGRITGMVDCKWVDESAAAFSGAHVSLGRKYVLASGLMEITYDSGAKVLLQGPAAYEVESRAGGFLSLGKLTAKVDKMEERRTKNEERSGPTSSFLIPHSYFAVRTPTATVTDLGTEFGVEVTKEGNTTSHVFRGSVEVRMTSGDGTSEANTRVLHEDESACVESVGGECRLTVPAASPKPAGFVRALPKATIKMLDLVDVVVGGNGFTGRRNAGIDPTNGRPTDQPPTSPDFLLTDDGSYHRVDGLQFVDGVFVPDGRSGPVQIDSAGHTFTGFRTSDNRTSNHLWAGGIVPVAPAIKDRFTTPVALGDVDYSSSGHGLLYMHANKGITFDLDAIRHANPGCKILRFRAVAGNTEPWSANGEKNLSADLSVLVDSQVRMERRDVNGINGAIWVVVPITDKDRFLTLTATDGGNGIASDIVIFGDPRLEVLVVEH